MAKIRDRLIAEPSSPCFIDNVNFNIRSKHTHGSNCNPIDKNKVEPGSFYIFKYNSDMPNFKIVDGQTRIAGAVEALQYAKRNNQSRLLKDLEKITIAFNLTFTDDEYKESYIFYLINSYSKALPPDGASRLIYQGFIRVMSISKMK